MQRRQPLSLERLVETASRRTAVTRRGVTDLEVAVVRPAARSSGARSADRARARQASELAARQGPGKDPVWPRRRYLAGALARRAG